MNFFKNKIVKEHINNYYHHLKLNRENEGKKQHN